MRLYSFWRSSCSWRVRLALGIKGIPHEIVPVHLLKAAQHADGFDQTSPLRQVPILEWEHAGQTVRLAQSVAIIEYLEEAQPLPALFPKDTLLRARVRQLVEIVNSGIQPAQNLHVLNEVARLGANKKEWAQNFLQRGLLALEAAATPFAGAFLLGDSASAADVFLAPQLYNARRFDIDLSSMTSLLRAEASLQALPAWAPAHPDAQPDAEKE